MSPPSSFHRTASRALVLSGVVSIGVGLLTTAFPPAVDPSLWGYPFDPTTHVVVAIVLVFLHLLKAVGFVGLSRLDGAGGLVRGSMLVAALGFVVLATCEGVSGTMVGVPLTSPEAVQLNNGYGAGSMLSALPSMVGGVFIARRGLLPGAGRWSVFASGAFMVFVVTPALLMGRTKVAYLALTAWSLFFLWIGLAMRKSEAG